jgi:hypothetical protein
MDRDQIARILESQPPAPASCPHAWQPIETAPKDGSDMPLLVNDIVTYGGWVSVFEPGYWWNAAGIDADPTHWFNLPAPPVAPKGGK